MSSTMYELTQDYKTVQDMLYTGVDEQTVMDTLESIAGEIEEKADGYGKIIRNIETDIAGLKDEEKRLSERRRGLENQLLRLKKSMEDAMRTVGTAKIKTPLFSFYFQKNPPSVEITDEAAALASAYIRQKTEIDKAKIKEALENGESLSFAQLTQSESLRMK